jgi:hypothetical protein
MLRTPRYTALVGGIIALFATWTWFHAVGHPGVNGQDGHDYWRLATEWSAWLEDGPRPVRAEHPHGYPVLGALLGMFAGGELWGLRFASAIALLVLVLLWSALLRTAFTSTAGVDLFLLVGLVLSPFLLRYSVVVMSDVPALALMAAALVATLRWSGSVEGRADLVWLFLAMVLGVCALSVRMAVAPALAVYLVAWVHGPAWGRRWRWRVALVLAACALPLIFGTEAGAHLWAGISGPLGDWSPLNMFRRELRSDDGVLHYALPNVLYVLKVFIHPGFLPIGPLLLPFFRRSDLELPHARLAGWTVVVYLLFIAGLPFQNDRVLLFAQPFVVLLMFPAFLRGYQWLLTWGIRPVLVFALIACAQALLFVRAMVPFVQQALVERELIALIVSMAPRHVYTHGMGAAFHTGCPGVRVTELWYKDLEGFEQGALFVVRPSDLVEQWKGLPPCTNWERVQRQGASLLLERSDEWVVARVRRSPNSVDRASKGVSPHAAH